MRIHDHTIALMLQMKTCIYDKKINGLSTLRCVNKCGMKSTDPHPPGIRRPLKYNLACHGEVFAHVK